MDEIGFLYVPTYCETERCNLHVAFHGCRQYRKALGTTFAENSGYLEWAASNNLLILFPQASPSDLNPFGCWDFWGYTGEDFLSKTGA